MRFYIFLIVLVGINLYAFQALIYSAQYWGPVLKYLSYTLFWLVPIVLGTLVYGNNYFKLSETKKTEFHFLRVLFILFSISILVVSAVLLVDDLSRVLLVGYKSVTGHEVQDPGRSLFVANLALVLGALPLVTLTYGMARNKYRYKTYKKDVKIAGLSPALKGLRIVQISDIHSGSFTEKLPLKSAIDIINRIDADLVFFTGDLVNYAASEMDDYIDVFDKIKARYGVYSILGNHDYGDYVRWPSKEAKAKNLDNLKKVHHKLGWHLLLNQHEVLEVNGVQVAIIGVENYSAKFRFTSYGNLKEAYHGCEDCELKLLLSHDPSHWAHEVVPNFKDIHITFSGHTHGFQFGIELPGIFKWSPIQYVYKQWAGLYQKGGQYLYVNRGFGFLGYPGRVGILPEITEIQLT